MAVWQRETTLLPPYSSPDPPPPGLPSTQQLGRTQLPPQQTQPPPLTGPQYYTQLAYPAVSGTGNAVKGGLVTHTHYPSPHTTQPQVVQTQPQQPIVATQQGLIRPRELSTKLPKYAFVTSIVGTFIFTALCWLPGLLCLVPATVMSIVVSSTHSHTRTPHTTHGAAEPCLSFKWVLGRLWRVTHSFSCCSCA